MKFQLLIASLILSTMTVEVVDNNGRATATFVTGTGSSSGYLNTGNAVSTGAFYNQSQNINMAPKVYT